RRKRARAMVAFLAASLACGGSGHTALQAGDSILVQLEAGAAPPRRNPPDSGPPIVPLTVVSAGDAPFLRVPRPGREDAARAADDAAAAPGVAYAEPIFVYRATRTPDDARFKDLWGMARIGATAAWNTTTGDRDVTVAIVDDGVALDHPDLRPNLWT